MEKASWTVMVYLAGDNNLTSECMFALTEMKKATLGKEINVIAQFDPSDPHLPTHRYEVNCNRDQSLHHDLVDRAVYDFELNEVHFGTESKNAETLAAVRKLGRGFRNATLDAAMLIDSTKCDDVITDDTDTGSPIPLYNFISFCLEKYPADHYLIVLSGHAGGTERDYLLRDESSARSLTFSELKEVFKRVRDDRQGALIDIVGMDTCLMSMAEICYELRGLAEVVVGCESFSPSSGWPYREILQRLYTDSINAGLTEGETVAGAAAKSIVEEYVNYYSCYWMAGMSVTQSALNLRAVDKLQFEVDKLGVTMEQELLTERDNRNQGDESEKRTGFQDALLLAHWETQSYNGEQFVDLYDFCDRLRNRTVSGAVVTQCREVQHFLEAEFVLKSCYCGADYQYSYGVSLYFPWSHIAPSYWNLDFVHDETKLGWGSFLKTYTLLTRREPRGMSAGSNLGDTIRATIDARLDSVRMVGMRMAGLRMSEDRMTGLRMSESRMSESRMSEDRASECRMDQGIFDGRMGLGLARNRVHSMRNPPNVFLPDECVRDSSGIVHAQEFLRILK